MLEGYEIDYSLLLAIISIVLSSWTLCLVLLLKPKKIPVHHSRPRPKADLPIVPYDEVPVYPSSMAKHKPQVQKSEPVFIDNSPSLLNLKPKTAKKSPPRKKTQKR